MAKHKAKNYYTGKFVVLLFLLAVLFCVIALLFDKPIAYRPAGKEIGYIDTNAVYRSNKNYLIAKKEIDEYSARINNELERALAREKDSAKRAKLKRNAKREIALYADTLLQDINKDVDDAINEVADSKNLRRVYVGDVSKHGAKNFTNAVISELNQTFYERLEGYLESPAKSDKQQNEDKVWQKQFNFNAYPVANVPEKGIQPNFSARLAKTTDNGGTIVAATLSPEMDRNERFAWQRSNLKNKIKNAKTEPLVVKKKQLVLAVKSSNIKLQQGKAKEIIEGWNMVVALINSRNVALANMQMTQLGKCTKDNMAVAEKNKTAKKNVMSKVNVAQRPSGKIAVRPNVITGCQIKALLEYAGNKSICASVWLKDQGTKGFSALWNKAETVCVNLCRPYKAEKSIVDNKPEPKSVEPVATKAESVTEPKTTAAQTVKDKAVKSEPKTAVKPEENKPEEIAEEQKSAETEKVVAQPKREISNPVTIQVAACINKSGAENAVAKIKRKNIPVRLSGGISRNGRQWWYVRVYAKNASQAKNYVQQLAAMGYSGLILKR